MAGTDYARDWPTEIFFMILRTLPPPTDTRDCDLHAGLGPDVLNEKMEQMLQETCEALSYAWYLSKSAADVETETDHAAYLASLSENIKLIHERIMADLLDRARPVDETGSTMRR